MEQRVVIVTGASSGIGWAVARWAACKEFRVVLAARREDRLHDLAARIAEDGGTALVVPVDIARPEDQRRLIEETVRAFGRIDVLVNNAGVPLPTPFAESSAEDLRRQWDVNVTTLATLTRLALPYLGQHSHELHPGTVVNIGSGISRFAVPGMGNYSPTKIAVAGLSEALRRELEPRGVHVCLVEPGPVAETRQRSGGAGGRCPARQPGGDGQAVLQHAARAERSGLAVQQEAEAAGHGGEQGQAHGRTGDHGSVGSASRGHDQDGEERQAREGEEVPDPGHQGVQNVVGGAEPPAGHHGPADAHGDGDQRLGEPRRSAGPRR